MAFSVAVDQLVLSKPGLPPIAIPADVTRLSPPKLKRNWKVTEGFGLKGAFCVYTGEGLAAFDATFEFWNENTEPQWNLFAALYLGPPDRNPAALGIYHPILIQAPFKIDSVQLTEIEGWSMISPGKWQTRLSFLQFRTPVPFVPASTEPGVPTTSKVPPATPKTAQDFRAKNAAARFAWVSHGNSLEGFVPPYPGY